MVEAKLLRKKLKNGLIVDKWDLVTIIEKQQAEIEVYKESLEKLAKLGNGDIYGNSIGNDIAIEALRKAQEK